MTKTKLRDLIELSRECIIRFWQGDYKFVLEHFNKNATWIGSVQEQFLYGYDLIKEDYEKVCKTLKHCHLSNQEFYAASNCGSTCTIVGRYVVKSDYDQDVFLQTQQRCTFVWETNKGKDEIKCAHVSNPIGELKVENGEIFPSKMGEMIYKYMMDEIDRVKNARKPLCIYDKFRRLRITSIYDIKYVETFEKILTIHTVDDKIEAKMKLSEFLQQAGNDFYRMHRSYAVNIRYIERVDNGFITIMGGDKVPIPDKKGKQVKEEIAKRLQN